MMVRDEDARPQHITDVNPAARIAALNDRLRRHRSGGRVLITAGVTALGEDALPTILNAVASFTAFTDDNDPHGEHDFGAFQYGSDRLFWKIDYYDLTMEGGSSDPADPAVTIRVLTVMLPAEY